jgi:hypothetical protein
MTWLWVLIGIFAFVLFLYVSNRVFTARWKTTFREVLSEFLIIKEDNPEEGFDFWYFLTIEKRYSYARAGRLAKLHARKKALTSFTIYSESARALYTLLKKQNLASLILFCIVVENWQLLGKDLKLHYLYSKIEFKLNELRLEKFLEVNHD